ncbi:MAG: SusC/RagA family TonB-linked outer membrane protein [Bacteroidetes bacterium]|nr:SusC/RagA family TonB-linked outer membrane protein [Bacteroidota bacterium]
MTNYLRIFFKAGFILLFMVTGIIHAYPQERVITGTVTDAETGETLIGATITLAYNRSWGTVTDLDGKYRLAVPDTVKALSYSFVGYTTQIVQITANVIDVQLQPGQLLTEVVVVGYGTQKTREVTSAVTSVKSEDFNRGNITNPVQLIQGKVAGLAITRPGGDPNADFNIRLRGLSTFGSNTQPLVIIDGVQGASLKSVDPQDIASMDVLKDASAAAIYGTRAASGVILITTKKGEYVPGEKGISVDFNTSLTSEMIARHLDVLSRDEYLSFNGTTDFGNNTDWMDQITRNGFSQVYNLSMTGASESSSYRVSFNYRTGNGVVLKTGFDQFNGRLNFSQKALNNKLTFNLNLAATMRDETYGDLSALTYAARYNPTAPAHADDDFSKKWGGYFQREAFYFYNPLAILEQNTSDGKKNEIIGSIKADYNPVKSLVFSVFYSQSRGYDLYGQYWSKNSYWTPYAIGSHLGYARKETQDRFHQLFEVTGNFDKDFKKFNVKLLGGYSYQDKIDDKFWVFAKGFLTDGFSYNSLGSASGTLSNFEAMYSYKSGSTLIGFFARGSANWDDALFMTANFRRDGSSMFGENKKWGNFMGLSLGVDIIKFIEIPYVNRLKLRGGYGETGNLPAYPYLSQLLFNSKQQKFFYNGQYIQAYAPVLNENTDLKWEVKKEFGVGLDFYLFDYRVNGTLDYYRSTSTDLILLSRVASPPKLTDLMWLNLGELENSGIELAINIDAVKTDKFKWSTEFNFTKYFQTTLKKITSSLSTSESTIPKGYLGAPFLTGVYTIQVTEGEPIGQIIAPVFLGIDSTGHLMYEDIDGDGKFNAQTDFKIVGNGLPDFQLGWGNTLSYHNFNLNFFFRGVFGHSLVNVNNARYGVPVVIQVQSGMKQALDYKDASDGPVYSNVHVEKASYLKLDNFAFGYNFDFPNSKAISGLKVYLSGQNLFTITGYSGVEPEVRYVDTYDNDNPLAPGIDRENTYFSTRSLTFGVDILF